jgi:antitoxin ParD1/3/4
MATSYTVGKHYEKFIKDLVDSGRYATASEVMREGLRLVEEREERRKAKLEALRAAIQEGRDSGPAEPMEPGELVERIKARGRERLKAAEHGE